MADLSIDAMPLCWCGNRHYEFVASRQRDNKHIVVCCACGLHRNLPLPYLDDRCAQVYQESACFSKDRNDNVPLEQYAMELLHRLQAYVPIGTMLDVGCSDGFLCNVARSLGWNVVGVDVDRRAVEHGRSKHGLDLRHGTVSSLGSQTGEYDAIVLSHVLEHVIDLDGFISSCAARLKRGGALLVEVPNVQSIVFRVLRHRWLYVRPDMHVWHFDPTTLNSVLSKNGLDVVQQWTFLHYWKRQLIGRSWSHSLFRCLEEGAIATARLRGDGDLLCCLATPR